MKAADMCPATLRALADELDEEAKFAMETSEHCTRRQHYTAASSWESVATRAKSNARMYRNRATRAEKARAA